MVGRKIRSILSETRSRGALLTPFFSPFLHEPPGSLLSAAIRPPANSARFARQPECHSFEPRSRSGPTALLTRAVDGPHKRFGHKPLWSIRDVEVRLGRAMTPEDPPRPARSISWPWLLFGVGLVGVVVLLSYAALDRADVVWDGGEPFCPHCRTAVPLYSTQCPACRQSYDWASVDLLCTLCLTQGDVARIQAVPLPDREAAARKAFPDDPRRAEALLRWWREIRHGACVWCAGTGKDLFANPGEPGEGTNGLPPCPICLGDGDCILCGGDEKMRRGDPGAHRDLARYRERLDYLEGRSGHPDPAKVAEAVADAVRMLRGNEEIQQVNDAEGLGLVDRAVRQRDSLLRFLLGD
jgi:hypothetical protein